MISPGFMWQIMNVTSGSTVPGVRVRLKYRVNPGNNVKADVLIEISQVGLR